MTALRREESLKGVLQAQKTRGDDAQYERRRVQQPRGRSRDQAGPPRQPPEAAGRDGGDRLRGEPMSNIRIVDRALPPGPSELPLTAEEHARAFLRRRPSVGVARVPARPPRSQPAHARTGRAVPAASRSRRDPGLASPRGRRGVRLAPARGARRRRRKGRPASSCCPTGSPASRIAGGVSRLPAALLLSRAGGSRSDRRHVRRSRRRGKTPAVNLAIVLGQLGKRVLLVDADLHKSAPPRVFHISNRSASSRSWPRTSTRRGRSSEDVLPRRVRRARGADPPEPFGPALFGRHDEVPRARRPEFRPRHRRHAAGLPVRRRSARSRSSRRRRALRARRQDAARPGRSGRATAYSGRTCGSSACCSTTFLRRTLPTGRGCTVYDDSYFDIVPQAAEGKQAVTRV